MKYRLTINDVHHFPESAERLKNLLDFARGQIYADLSLTQIHDRKPKLSTKFWAWIMRADLASLNEGSEMTALINGNRAIAFFYYDLAILRKQPDIDIESLFLSSTNPDYGQEDNRKVEFIVGGSDLIIDPDSEPLRHPERKCVATDKVLSAFLSFYETGARPDCIDWEIDRVNEDEDVDIDSDL